MTDNSEHISFVERLHTLKGSMSLNAFSSKCDIPYSTMRGYFEKGTDPGLENLKKIAKACNVTISWLSGYEQDAARSQDIAGDNNISVGGKISGGSVVGTGSRGYTRTEQPKQPEKEMTLADFLVQDEIDLILRIRGLGGKLAIKRLNKELDEIEKLISGE